MNEAKERKNRSEQFGCGFLGPESSGYRTAWIGDSDPFRCSLALVERTLEQGEQSKGFSDLLRWSVGRHAVPPFV